jgi:hypothetical protein
MVKLLQKGDMFNVSDYINEIMSQIASWRHAQGGPIEDLLSMSTKLALILPTVLCNILRLAVWLELLVLSTQPIWHPQTFFCSVMSEAYSRNNTLRLGSIFYLR